MRGETFRRILVAVPWIVFAILIIGFGGPVFAVALFGLGVVGLHEFFRMSAAGRPLMWPAVAALAGLLVAALFGSSYNVLMLAALPFPLVFAAAVMRPDRTNVTISVALTMLGIYWIGLPLAHAVMLRELPEHGAGLLVSILVGTFAADTGAYAVGRAFGSRKLAPSLSPGKTVEGLIGGILIGTLGVWCAGLYQDWFSGTDALILGAAVAITAPLGDLFESLLKRDLGTKDTGTLFGPHGGLLDRLDAVFFTVVVGFYVASALVG